MLEQVTMGQTRFVAPGLAPDARGILLGRRGLLHFPTLEGVVSWLRVYSAEASLDELLGALELHRVTTPLKSREMLVLLPAQSSHSLDTIARTARLVGGNVFTGSTKHFVKYRDERAPFGYDIAELQPVPDDVDYLVHGDNYQQSYSKIGSVEFESLLFRLSLRTQPGGLRAESFGGSELYMIVQSGLAAGVIHYLWRSRVSAETARITQVSESSFAREGKTRSFCVFRVRSLPERMISLFHTMPGVELFRSVTSNVAVELGYRHMIDLSSCASLFDDSKFFFFKGKEDRVEVIKGKLELSSIEHLSSAGVELGNVLDQEELASTAVSTVSVDVELCSAPTAARPSVGSLISIADLARLKKLVYLLPPTALMGHRIVLSTRGALVLAGSQAEILPVGQLLCDLGGGILVPQGMELSPRVSAGVLAQALGHEPGSFTIFPLEGAPFQLSEASLVPLERRALAKLEVDKLEAVDYRTEEKGHPALVNDAVGRFALWAYDKAKTAGELGE